MPVLAKNKKALFDYEILETFEAGLQLAGQEVKSVKSGHISLKGAYVTLQTNKKGKKDAYLINAHIPPYKKAGPLPDYEPNRSRKLLLHRREIDQLIGKIQEKGLTLVPIKVYTKRNKIKLEFGLAKGRKKKDKRELIKKRDIDRQIRTQSRITKRISSE